MDARRQSRKKLHSSSVSSSKHGFKRSGNSYSGDLIILDGTSNLSEAVGDEVSFVEWSDSEEAGCKKCKHCDCTRKKEESRRNVPVRVDIVGDSESDPPRVQPDRNQVICPDPGSAEFSRNEGEDSEFELETKSDDHGDDDDSSSDEDFASISKSLHSNKWKGKDVIEIDSDTESEEDKRSGGKERSDAKDVTQMNGEKKKLPGLNIWVYLDSQEGPQVLTRMADRLRSSKSKKIEKINKESLPTSQSKTRKKKNNERLSMSQSKTNKKKNNEAQPTSQSKRNERGNKESGTSSVSPSTLPSHEQEYGAFSDHHHDHQISVSNTQEEKDTEEKGNDSKDDEQNIVSSSSDDYLEKTWKGMHMMPLRKRCKAIDERTVEKVQVDPLPALSPYHEQDDEKEHEEDDEQEHSEIPKNFGLEDYDAKPPEEKSYWDTVGEKLFEEMDFAMATEGIGSTHANFAVNNQTKRDNEGLDMLPNCGPNNHLLIHDEEIGLRCTRCSSVEVEIKYISPTFAANPWKNTKKKEFREKRNDIDIDQLSQMNFENGRTNPKEDIVDTAGTVWGLIPGTRRTMYSHQRDGFEFIWNNLEGSILLEDLKKDTSNGGNGCIISHAPGTGKTRLTIMFIKSYLELYPTRKVVIIAPYNMLLTWEEEFKKWKVNIPFHNLNKTEFSGQEDTAAVNLVRQLRHQQQVKNSNRLIKLVSWKKDKSVLGMSYGLFEKSAGDGGNMIKSGKNQIDGFQVMEMLRELPDLLVLDEGHTPRNENTQIWKALSRIKTQKRIILSGTPFQNNFRELYTTLCLIRPMFADKFIAENGHGTSTKRKRDGKEDIALNKWVSLTKGVCENDDDKLEEVRDIIYRMAHVYKGDILKESLPGLRDSLVVLKPTEFQNTILNVILKMKNGLEREHCISLVSVHPSLLIHSQPSEKEELSVYMPQLDAIKLNPEFGVKTKFLIELIRLSGSLNEKVLIFSQFIHPLNLIQAQLKSYFGWSEGKEMLYMDGAKDMKLRQLSITSFNNSESKVKVMLASTKACSEGISLVGASRVVLLDVVWNPSVERQAISRAYRLGQKKLVYTYHLVASEAETTKYDRQTQKDRLSKLVFCSADHNYNLDMNQRPLMDTAGEDEILQVMIQHPKTCHMFEKIINQEKESSLIDSFR